MHGDDHSAKAHGSPPDTSGAHPLDWPLQAGAVDEVLREMDLRVSARRRRRRWQFATTAAAAVALMFFAGQKFPSSTPATPTAVPTSATVLVPERQVLPDGSIVELKSGAKIVVTFTESLRRVALTSGEAHFQVASNPLRPFVVTASEVEFRAVGTAFSVQLGPEAVELLVTEGEVAVDKPTDAHSVTTLDATSHATVAQPATPHRPRETSSTLALVAAGNRLVVSTHAETKHALAPIEAVPSAELGERLAWRVPKLEFSGTPLSDAIPLFNRHSRAQLELGDADLASVRLSGILRADNVDTLLVLLEESHGIQVEKRAENRFILRRKR